MAKDNSGKIIRARITEKTFLAVKNILKGGASVSQTAEIMDVSTQTVYRIRVSESYGEYVNNQRRNGAARYKKPDEESPTKELKLTGGTLSESYQMNRIYEQQKQTNELLKLISDKLAYIVQQLS